MTTSTPLALIAAALLAATSIGCDTQESHAMPNEPNTTGNAQMDQKVADGTYEVATFGAGCFWGVEAAFRNVEGVQETAVGYAGGHVDRPTYEQVCTDTTGHAEVVRVVYDPQKVSYEKLLDVYFDIHDPTQVNRQGPDRGKQYRSVVFTHSDAQHNQAEKKIDQLAASGQFSQPIATQIEPAGDFWMAEEYHQQYLEKRGRATCHPNLK